MRDFVQRQTTDLLAKLSAEIERAAGDRHPDAIHDLRVAIRRLSRCLRVFSQFYPGRSWKKARAQLSELMHAAGAVRDRDIALELLGKAGFSARAAIAVRLRKERSEAHRELVAVVRRWRDRARAQKWTAVLGLAQ